MCVIRDGERGRDKMQSRVFHSSSAATFVGRRLRRLDKTNLDSREGSIRARECARMRAFAWSHARDPFAWWISLPSYPHKIISLGSDLCFERRICFFFLFSWRAERIGLFSSLKPLNIIYFKRWPETIIIITTTTITGASFSQAKVWIREGCRAGCLDQLGHDHAGARRSG